MTKQLILLEKGIPPHHWVDFVREIDNDGDSLVLSEEPLELNQLENLRIQIRSINEYYLSSGAREATLISEASNLVDSLITRAPLSAQTLEYDGLSLWDMEGYRNTFQVFFPILKKLEVLRTELRSTDWQRVRLLVNRGTLSTLFYSIAADIGFAGEVEEIPMAHHTVRLSLKGRLYRQVAQGWGDPLIYDIRDGFRFPWLPKQPHSYKADSYQLYLFLVGNYGIYISTMLPIIRKIQSFHEVLVLGQGGRSSVSHLRARAIDSSYWTQYVPLTAWPRIVRRTRQLHRAWDELQDDERVESLFEYGNNSLWPVLREPLQYMFLHQYPRMIVWAEALKHIFGSLQPCAVVAVPDRIAPARIALALARRYGVPSLTVQPALINDHPRYGPLYADKAAVMDDYSRRVYLERGEVAPERLVITGLPRWDGISKANQESAVSAVRESLGLSSEDRLVVFATDNAGLSYTQRAIQAVMRVMSRYADLRLVIKVHPAEALEDYYTLLSDLDSIDCKPIVVGDIDLHALLAASKLLVTGFSNVALEAVLLDKPVLIVNLTGEPDPSPFIQDAIVLGAYSEAEIEQQIDRIMSDPLTAEQLRVRRHQYMQRNTQLTDGKATDRVVDLLRQMTQS